MADEIELKLALGAEAPDALRRHPRLAGAMPALTRLGNTYYDTPQGELADAHMALRLRRANDRLLQTLKTRGQGGGGLSTRGEWEWEVPGPGLDLDGLAELPPLAERDPALLARLTPRFTTDFVRETWWLEQAGTTLELALDLGEIRAGGKTVVIRELELELKAGEPAALWTLAETLAETLALRPSDTSKAARGGALLGDGWTLPAAHSPADALHRAAVALDALADTDQDAWRLAAQRAFQRLSDETALDGQHRDAARALAQALNTSAWLTPAFGRRMLALARQLPGDSELA